MDGILELFDLMKAGKREGLVPVKRQVTMGGKTFERTYWVDPGTGDVPAPGARPLAAMVDAVAEGRWDNVREAMEDLLYEKCGGCLSKQNREQGGATVADMSHDLAGLHHWNGKIEISPDVAAMAQEFARAWRENPKGVRDAMQAWDKLTDQIDRIMTKLNHTASLKKVIKLQDKADKIWTDTNALRDASPEQLSAYERYMNQVNELDVKRQAEKEKLKALVLQRSSEAVVPGQRYLWASQGFRTLLHEVYHGYGPMEKDGYQGAGLVVEEVTTEVLARADLTEHFGVPASYIRKNGSYQPWVQTVVDGIRKVYGISEDKAWSFLEDAAQKIKETSEGGERGDQYAQRFAMMFRPTGDEVKDKPRNALMAKHPLTGEYFDQPEWMYTLYELPYQAGQKWQPRHLRKDDDAS